MEVLLDPFSPKNCPKFTLHGRPDVIKQFQQRLNEINPVSILIIYYIVHLLNVIGLVKII